MSCAIIFVCHDNSTIESVLKHNHFIMFVGDKEIKDEHRENPKIIIARDLEHNIEKEWNLLTFTAWYAIIKNNLFIDYEYLCILEYDVILDNFEQNLYSECKKNHDIISFFQSNSNGLRVDINYNVCIEYLILQNLSKGDFDNINIWSCSTNHCMKRNIVNDFVNWYYPSCLFIKDKDYKKLGYYHERLFAIYCNYKQYNNYIINGIIQHLQLVSHKT